MSASKQNGRLPLFGESWGGLLRPFFVAVPAIATPDKMSCCEVKLSRAITESKLPSLVSIHKVFCLLITMRQTLEWQPWGSWEGRWWRNYAWRCQIPRRLVGRLVSGTRFALRLKSICIAPLITLMVYALWWCVWNDNRIQDIFFPLHQPESFFFFLFLIRSCTQIKSPNHLNVHTHAHTHTFDLLKSSNVCIRQIIRVKWMYLFFIFIMILAHIFGWLHKKIISFSYFSFI